MTVQPHILCLCPPGSKALEEALVLAESANATLHVIPLRGTNGHADERDEIQSRLNRLGRAHSPRTTMEITRPTDAEVTSILDAVSDADVDLLVADLPSEGDAIEERCISIIRQLLDELDCPVLVPNEAGDLSSVEHILVPTDLSDHALRALQQTVDLARMFEAAIEVLYVIESIPYVALTAMDRLSFGPMSLSEHRGRRDLRAFLKEARQPDVPMEPHLAYGDPAEQIARHATHDDIDLVVLSSHGTTGQSDRPWGHVPERLLEHGLCPTLLLPAFGPDLPSSSPEKTG